MSYKIETNEETVRVIKAIQDNEKTNTMLDAIGVTVISNDKMNKIVRHFNALKNLQIPLVHMIGAEVTRYNYIEGKSLVRLGADIGTEDQYKYVASLVSLMSLIGLPLEVQTAISDVCIDNESAINLIGDSAARINYRRQGLKELYNKIGLESIDAVESMVAPSCIGNNFRTNNKKYEISYIKLGQLTIGNDDTRGTGTEVKDMLTLELASRTLPYR